MLTRDLQLKSIKTSENIIKMKHKVKAIIYLLDLLLQLELDNLLWE
jgi:hypothetical protein